jgi:hypothetical protein
MFKAYKEETKVNMEVNECYTTYDQALKYTMVHLVDRQRPSAMEKFMLWASPKYGIVFTEVFGYKRIDGNNSSNELYDHIGFKMLYEHKMGKNPAFTEWIEAGVHGGGIFKKYRREQARAGTAAAQNQGTISSEDDEPEDAGQKRASESGGAPPSKRTKTTTGNEDEEEEEEEFDPSVTVNYGFNGEVRGYTRIITDLRDSRVCLPDGSIRPEIRVQQNDVAPQRTKPPAVEATKAELKMENTGLKQKLAEIMIERLQLYKENDGLTNDKKILERQLKEQKEQMETMEIKV